MGAGDFVLFESASGYALCEVVEFEEIGSTTKEVQETVGDLKRFSRCVKLKAFCPFESAEQALANINAISEHIVPDELKDFLELQLPSVKKSSRRSACSWGGKNPMTHSVQALNNSSAPLSLSQTVLKPSGAAARIWGIARRRAAVISCRRRRFASMGKKKPK